MYASCNLIDFGTTAASESAGPQTLHCHVTTSAYCVLSLDLKPLTKVSLFRVATRTAACTHRKACAGQESRAVVVGWFTQGLQVKMLCKDTANAASSICQTLIDAGAVNMLLYYTTNQLQRHLTGRWQACRPWGQVFLTAQAITIGYCKTTPLSHSAPKWSQPIYTRPCCRPAGLAMPAQTAQRVCRSL